MIDLAFFELTGSDMVGAAVYLASRASDYVHGSVLVVDGWWLGR